MQPSGLARGAFRPAKFSQNQPTAQMVKAIMPEHSSHPAAASKALRVNASRRMARHASFRISRHLLSDGVDK